MTAHDPVAAWRRNPFFVLEVRADATLTEIERAGQRLLALLAVGSATTATYQTPLGPAPRNTDLVRHALATLRDPDQRALHELWAAVEPRTGPKTDLRSSHDHAAPYEHAEQLIGWSAPWAR